MAEEENKKKKGGRRPKRPRAEIEEDESEVPENC